jgi:hypothetical protein
MSKIVNIYPTMPITSVNPPIRGKLMGVRRTTADIRACIIGRARVEELLPNGKTIPLDFTNYDKDNYVKEPPKEEPKLMNAPELPAANFATVTTPTLTLTMPAQEEVVEEAPDLPAVDDNAQATEEPEVEEEPEVVSAVVAEEVQEEVEPEEEEEKKEEAPQAEVDPVRAAIEAVDTEVVEIEDDGEMEGLSDIEDVIETKDPDEVE